MTVTTLRIRNVTENETCRMCTRGLALVSTRPDGQRVAEEYGPCPFCELGERLEFPREGKSWPTWGTGGFWRGREPEVAAPLVETASLSRHENALRMRLLNRRMGGDVTADPLVGIDIRDAGKRMAVLERAVAR